VVNGLPESGPSARGRHPHLYGMLVALVGFLLVALPAALSAFFAVLSFTGCPDNGSGPVSSEQGIFGCHEPEPLNGTLAALLALVLLALPVIAGVLTARAVARVHSRQACRVVPTVPVAERWSFDKIGPHTTDERPLVPNGRAIRVELTRVKGESRVMAWSGRLTNDPKPFI